MDVIGHTAGEEGLAPEVVGGPAEDAKQLVAPVVGQNRLAILGREYEMQINLCQRLRHGSAREERPFQDAGTAPPWSS